MDSKKTPQIIIKEDTSNNNNNNVKLASINTNSNNGSPSMKKSSSLSPQKLASEVKTDCENNLKLNNTINAKNKNTRNRRSGSISRSNSELSNKSQNSLFIPPQIILSFDEDENNINNNGVEVNKKVLYTSNQGYRVGDDNTENSFEDLNRIINFGYEKEPETDGFSVLCGNKPQDELEDEKELEEKRKNSIKYADSGLRFDKFNSDEDAQDEVEEEEEVSVKEPPSPINKVKIPDKIKNSASKPEEVYERQQNVPRKKSSLQTPSLKSKPKRGRRYSTMDYIPIKDTKITSDNIGSTIEALKLKSQFDNKNNRGNSYSDYSYGSNKFMSSVKEFIPQRGLIYSEFQDYESGWILCKPKLLPLKSIEIQKIEKMEKEVAKARKNTGLRLIRTTSAQNTIVEKSRSKEVHTSPSILSINNKA